MKIVTLTMNPAFDLMVEIENIILGSVNKAHQQQLFCGGKGLNVSRVLSCLGKSSTATGLLGEEQDTSFAKEMKKLDIQDKFQRIPGKNRINIKLLTKNNVTTDLNATGNYIQQEYKEKLNNTIKELAEKDTLFILSGSLPPGIEDEFYYDKIMMLKEKGCQVYLDTSGEPLKKAIAANPDMVKPNINELAEICGVANLSIIEAKDIAKEWIKNGCKVVIISVGKLGALLVDKKNSIWINTPQSHVVNTVGSGDTLVAGFAFAMVNDWEITKAAMFATALATYSVRHIRLKTVDIDTIDEIMKKSVITYL